MSLIRRGIRATLKLLPSGTVLPILRGPMRGRRWIINSANPSHWLGTYEKETQQAFLSAVRPGDVLYDIGANVGFYSLLASKLVGSDGRVIAFEPIPRNLAFLRRHLELNNVRNVTIIEAAVGSSSGEARFTRGESHAEGYIAPTGELVVPSVLLEDLVRDGTIPPPTCIKMDIEGGETAVIASSLDLIARSHPTFFLSTHGYDIDSACREMLLPLGYRFDVVRNGDADGQYENLVVWQA